MADFMYQGWRYRKQFVTTEEAASWEAELKKRLRLKLPFEELLDAQKGRLTIDGLLSKTYERYWDKTANRATQLVNIRSINKHFGPNCAVESIDAAALDDFIGSMEQRGLAPSTINGRLATLSKAFFFAQDRGYISSGPKIERKKVSNQRMRFFSEEEEYNIIEVLRADGRDGFASFFEWSLDTGIRPIESRHVSQGSVRKDPKLGPLVDLRKTKNAHPRTIPLTQRALNSFHSLSDEFMPFARFTETSIRKHWKFVREALSEKDPEFVFYLTRHTCASRLVQRGVPLYVVKEWMGHKTYEMTMRYAKLSPQNMLDARIALEGGC